MDDLAKDLRARRGELGLTQAQMADAFGVSLRTYSAWERVETSPVGDTARAVEGFLAGRLRIEGPDDAKRLVAVGEEPSPRSLGERLRHIRGLAAISRAEMAEAMGVDEKFVEYVEQGHEPSWPYSDMLNDLLVTRRTRLIKVHGGGVRVVKYDTPHLSDLDQGEIRAAYAHKEVDGKRLIIGTNEVLIMSLRTNEIVESIPADRVWDELQRRAAGRPTYVRLHPDDIKAIAAAVGEVLSRVQRDVGDPR